MWETGNPGLKTGVDQKNVLDLNPTWAIGFKAFCHPRSQGWKLGIYCSTISKDSLEISIITLLIPKLGRYPI